jgi:UDP-N-acetylmuramate--alanine ligase
MSALARFLDDRGIQVTGSDLRCSRAVVELQRAGIHVAAGHAGRNLPARASRVVRSLAVPGGVPELQAARQRGLPVQTYPEAIAELARTRTTIGVAGTHGKTTTAAMLGHVLLDTGRDPSWIFGGAPGQGLRSSRAGAGELLVLESCEYARSFLGIPADLAVVTTIDDDHLDCYGDLRGVQDAFTDFALRVVGTGGSLVWGASAELAAGLARAGVPPERLVTVGPAGVWRARRVRRGPDGCDFELEVDGRSRGAVRLPLCGAHNVHNALVVLAAADRVGVPVEAAALALTTFAGASRRLEYLGELQGARLYDDYAHHPTEVRATLEALRQAHPGQRLIAVFEPHLVSRTRQMEQEFALALGLADLAAVTEIYAARGTQVNGYSGRQLAGTLERLGATVSFTPSLRHVESFLARTAGAGDVVVMMGAGEVGDSFATLAAESRS